jgi:hypothetical protein
MAARRCVVIAAVVAGLCAAGAAHADHVPAIVVPGKRGVPVIINGEDASGAIVIGDWGLYRPGHVAPIVIRRRPWPVLGHRRPAPRIVHRRPRAAPCACRRRAVVHHHHHHHHHRRAVRATPRRAVVHAGPRHYFPGGTAPPRLGRREVEGARFDPPVPAESFSRSWSARSTPTPATLPQAPIVVAPMIATERHRPRPAKPGP